MPLILENKWIQLMVECEMSKIVEIVKYIGLDIGLIVS